MRGATAGIVSGYFNDPVSIHAPMRGATVRRPENVSYGRSFNPRAHAGRDLVMLESIQSLTDVSIHAPMRGATKTAATAQSTAFVSIHAPMRGATGNTGRRSPTSAFQSTRPCGARHRQNYYNHLGIKVSIHAPMRGATIVCVLMPSAPFCFNPRAHAGRDSSAAFSLSCLSSFNPRAHAGRDGFTAADFADHREFQSTRPCGARLFNKFVFGTHGAFQSTRPCGARRRTTMTRWPAACVSIHAPMRGATGLGSLWSNHRSRFNPRAHAGRDTTRR